MKKVSVVVLLLFTVSCMPRSSGGAPVEAEPRQHAPISQFDELTLERTACYGTCPVYRVVIRGDGSVEYAGYKFVKAGSARASLPQEQLNVLVAAINDARYFSLRDSYRNTRDGCPGHVTDAPSAITSVTSQGRSKKIHHYLGCLERADREGRRRAYPPELTALEERIDEIVDTARWVKGQSR